MDIPHFESWSKQWPLGYVIHDPTMSVQDNMAFVFVMFMMFVMLMLDGWRRQ